MGLGWPPRGYGGTVRIWDPVTGTTRHTLTGHTGGVEALVVAPDGSWLASAERRWSGADLGPGHRRHPPHPHRPHRRGAGIGGGPGWVLAGLRRHGGEVRIWDPATGATRHTLTGHTRGVSALVVAPDGSWLASAGDDGEVRIWDPATGATRHTLTGHTRGVSALVVAPDGSWLASAGDDREVRIWDPATGATRHTLTGHTRAVSALVVAPDGSWLASAGYGEEVRIWDPDTGCHPPHPHRPHRRVVRALAVAPDGSWLASASDDGEVRIWDPSHWRTTHVAARRGPLVPPPTDTDDDRSRRRTRSLLPGTLPGLPSGWVP